MVPAYLLSSAQRQTEILEFLRQAEAPLNQSQIATGLKIDKHCVSVPLWRLMRMGFVRQVTFRDRYSYVVKG